MPRARPGRARPTRRRLQWQTAAVDAELEQLAAELAALHRGRGLRRPAIDPGPALREALRLTPDDDPVAARQRLVGVFKAATAAMSPDLRVVFLHASAISCGDATLRDRLTRVATVIDRDTRTVRRRLLQANLAVAGYLLHGARPPAPAESWFVESMRSIMDLRGPRPVQTTYRTVCPTHRGVTVFRDRFGIPHPADSPVRPYLRVVAGGELASLEQQSASLWGLEVRLDHEVAVGESHEIGIEVTLPDREAIRPYTVAIPLGPTRSFTATVHFGDPPAASQAWEIDGLPPAALDDGFPSGRIFDPATAPDITVEFGGLQLGLAYGLGWSWA